MGQRISKHWPTSFSSWRRERGLKQATRKWGEGPGLVEACPALCGSRDVLGRSQDELLDQTEKDVLVLSHWQHLWKSSSKPRLFRIPGMCVEQRVLVTYISAFETCFKRFCSGRNSWQQFLSDLNKVFSFHVFILAVERHSDSFYLLKKRRPEFIWFIW